ncbi:MAG: hypothetical protein KC422_25230, partial [Trueperaceae bacterium]|nr:hypothetical protein [Trueperaceae bacterium]
MSVTLKLLGKARLKHEDEWLEPALGKPFCLLAYLAYNGSWLSREELAFIFWPDMDDGSARRNLRQLLNRAKRLPFSTGLELETTRLA